MSVDVSVAPSWSASASGALAKRAAPRRESALEGLRGSPLQNRFRSWRGRSGRKYIFSVFPVATDAGLAAVPDLSDAVIIAASVDAEGSRKALWVGQTGPCPELTLRGRSMADLRAGGATELHIHLLASGTRARRALIEDLA